MTQDFMLRVPFVNRTGATLVERRHGFSQLALEVSPGHCDRFGFLHGGVATTLMDSACAIALREIRGESATRHASIEMNASFLGQAAPGDNLVVEGRILRLEDRVAFGEAAMRRGDGELIATARVTFGIEAP
jgi:uncharacterized protein (TIGR00369 family)